MNDGASSFSKSVQSIWAVTAFRNVESDAGSKAEFQATSEWER